MNSSSEFEKEFSQFPAMLRDLVIAELEAGNEIAELGHGFPAAPCGAYIKLARPVISCIRLKTTKLNFFDRNCSSYSGEFTDAMRHFFVLEPPHPPEPAQDMNVIRTKLEASYPATNPALQTPTEEVCINSQESPVERAIHSQRKENPNSIVARFKASMKINYEKWHDGIGYDLELLQRASREERTTIEDILIAR